LPGPRHAWARLARTNGENLSGFIRLAKKFSEKNLSFYRVAARTIPDEVRKFVRFYQGGWKILHKEPENHLAGLPPPFQAAGLK
jgi:hypothetical protein